MTPKRGEIWLVDFGMVKGYEQAGERPAVVIQSDSLSQLSTVIVVPTTTSRSVLQRGTVLLPASKGSFDEPSAALCYQVRAVDRYRIKKRLGKLPETALAEIETTLAYVLGLAI